MSPAASPVTGGHEDRCGNVKVYVTRDIPAEALAPLLARHDVERWPKSDEPVPRDELLRAVAAADGLLCLLTERVDRELLAVAPHLRCVSTMAVGYDNIDLAACAERGVVVCHTPDVLTETTADLAWALLMAAARRIPEADAYLKAGRWRTWAPLQLVGQDVHGRVLGIVGMGRIGRAVARRATGFGMRVLYCGGRSDEATTSAEPMALPDLLSAADFISLHCPLDAQTHHLIGARELAWMKPTAVLVNTARGAIVDEVALYAALTGGRLWAAGLDVWEREPTAADNPLLQLENVVGLPHIGSATLATRTSMAALAAANLLAVLDGRPPPHRVSPP